MWRLREQIAPGNQRSAQQTDLNSEKTHLNMLLRHYPFFTKQETTGKEAYTISTVFIGDLDESVYKQHLSKPGKTILSACHALYAQSKVLARESVRRVCGGGNERFVCSDPGRRVQGRSHTGKRLPTNCWRVIPRKCITVPWRITSSKSGCRTILLPSLFRTAEKPASVRRIILLSKAGLCIGGELPLIRLGSGSAEGEVRENEFPFLYRYEGQKPELYPAGSPDLYYLKPMNRDSSSILKAT